MRGWGFWEVKRLFVYPYLSLSWFITFAYFASFDRSSLVVFIERIRHGDQNNIFCSLNLNFM